MAHPGSAFSAPSNDFCEARYQNECWYSIAWSNCCCASGLQDVWKWTLPRSSAGAAKADDADIPAMATTAIVVEAVLIMAGTPCLAIMPAGPHPMRAHLAASRQPRI